MAYFSLAHVSVPLPLQPTLQQTLFHLLAYAILALLLSGAWLPPFPKNLSGVMIKAGLVSFCYGALLEGVQAFLPWRAFELWDLTFNGLGALLGLVIFWAILRRMTPLVWPSV
ncbi:MAG: VanZ family protein [Candidatus Methylomirabilales bacterium]